MQATTQKMKLLLLLIAMVLGLSAPVQAQLTIGGKSDRHYIGPRTAPQRGFLREGPGVCMHRSFGAGRFKDHGFVCRGRATLVRPRDLEHGEAAGDQPNGPD